MDRYDGTITLDVEIEITSHSGREKHTDPVEQGTILADVVESCLREKMASWPDVKVGSVKFAGHREGRAETRSDGSDGQSS
jgi:hypothetical protein